ncbi:GTP cyclohydrolase [Roseivirga seohaensis subsp. aquiponti]|uniref:GTP cyclohydrolase 1 n=1 Tax=Roseivirga seohaensis subsp. aquiponti TaxID=1566026 RepID=A0A0L8AQ24_9BACT|nr:GTP cyclohydrolase I FolE [Roseivirga seohaensis]KOF04340.1 GTP cyclohydrolase [Roseivirga seohaensis subsp. aquiponti]
MKNKNGKSSEDLLKQIEEMGDDHVMSSIKTPMREGAFDLSDEEKIAIIQGHFEKIMHTLGLDLTDDSLSGTPKRVAKLYVKELFKGLKPENKPSLSTFQNKYEYSEMLVEKNITLYSNCEHHFLPIVGKAHVAYIPNGNVIGLSKINRIVDYYSRRPQVQERLALQILDEMKRALNTEDVAVYIDAEHMCVSSRGVSDQSSSTVTVEYSGKFKEEETKREFLTYVNDKLK